MGDSDATLAHAAVFLFVALGCRDPMDCEAFCLSFSVSLTGSLAPAVSWLWESVDTIIFTEWCVPGFGWNYVVVDQSIDPDTLFLSSS